MATARFGMTLNEVTTSLLNRNANEANNFQLIDNLAMMLTKNNVLGDGIYIATDKIRARDGDGLQLQDAGGNGITIASGGLITLAGHHLTPAASSNMFFGVNAGYNNTTGHSNSFFGANAGYTNTTGLANSFFGTAAGYANTEGHYNSFFGRHTGYSNTTGTHNSFFGMRAGYANTTGTYNSFFGMNAGYTNTTGVYNSFFGMRAGYANTEGESNSFFGMNAGSANTTGDYNSFFGVNAGYTNTTGTNLTCVGYDAQASAVGATNEVTLGNGSVTTLRCNTQNITGLSDRRDKTAIEPIQLGLDFVRDLKPVRWVWNCRDGSRIGDEDTGFIAQDLDDSQQKFGYEIPGLVFKPSDDRWEASSGKLLPVAIKAIQELAEKVELLEDQINA